MNNDEFYIPEKEYQVSKTFRFPESLAKRLTELADKKNISLNKLVVLCCEFAIDRLNKEDAENQ